MQPVVELCFNTCRWKQQVLDIASNGSWVTPHCFDKRAKKLTKSRLGLAICKREVVFSTGKSGRVHYAVLHIPWNLCQWAHFTVLVILDVSSDMRRPHLWAILSSARAKIAKFIFHIVANHPHEVDSSPYLVYYVVVLVHDCAFLSKHYLWKWQEIEALFRSLQSTFHYLTYLRLRWYNLVIFLHWWCIHVDNSCLSRSSYCRCWRRW